MVNWKLLTLYQIFNQRLQKKNGKKKMRNLINFHVKYFLSRIMKRYWKFLDVYVKISRLWFRLWCCLIPLLVIFFFQEPRNTNFKSSPSSDSEESACNAGELGSSPGLRRSPGEGDGYPFQHACLENSMNRGTWRATIHGVTKSWTPLKRLSSSTEYKIMS